MDSAASRIENLDTGFRVSPMEGGVMSEDDRKAPATRGDVDDVKSAVRELSTLIKGEGRHDGLVTQFRVLQWQVKAIGAVLALVAAEAFRGAISWFNRGGGQ